MQRSLGKLIEELRKRSVIRAVVTYCVVAWVMLQVADVTFERLPIPDGSMTLLIALVIIGLPITIIITWAYDFTLQGIVRYKSNGKPAPRLAFLPFAILVVTLTSAVGYGLIGMSQRFWVTETPSLAVLPFTNISSEADTEYFADGLTDELQSLIVRLNEFRVISLSSVYELKDTDLDVPAIAQRLDVDYVLLGNVRRSEDQLRITARLLDGSDGSELWNETYNRKLSDIFSIQENIAREVAGSMQVVLPVSTEQRLAHLGTSNVEAYDLYLRALDYLRRATEQDTLAQAEDYLRRAVAIDPDFAKPYAAWCEVYLLRYERDSAVTNFVEAELACDRAKSRDNGGAEVHIALGKLYYHSGQYEAASAEFAQALALNNNAVDAYIGQARVYTRLHQLTEAEISLRHAIDIDSSYWLSFNELGTLLYTQGRYLEATEFYNEFARRIDDNARAYNNLGAAYYMAANFSAAAEAWERSISINPTMEAYSNTGSMYFYLGQFEKAADRYMKAADYSPLDYRLSGNLGDVYYFDKGKQELAENAYRNAIQLAEQRLQINPLDIDTISELAHYYSRIGEIEKALALNKEALEMSRENMYVHYNAALVFIDANDTVNAMASLERAVELGFQRELLPFDPGLGELRESEEFNRLINLNLRSTAAR